MIPYTLEEITKAREERLRLREKNGYDFQVGPGGMRFTYWVGHMILIADAPSREAAIDGLADKLGITVHDPGVDFPIH
jgi:hypothetical protein